MTTRNTDMIEETRFFNLEHKVNDLSKDMAILQIRVKEDHLNLKDAIKDLADSQKVLAEGITNQSISMAELKTSLQTIAKSITWFIPIMITILSLLMGGVYTFTQLTDSKLDRPDQVILQQTPSSRR